MYALLIAQHPDERAILALVLQRAGLAVITAGEPERAMKGWGEQPADLVLMALTGEALEPVRRIRAETDVPLLAITDGIGEETQARLLEGGADLVVQRPYSSRLLIAQVRALMRRVGSIPLPSLPSLTMSGVTLDPVGRTVKPAGLPPQRLTHLEFRLLYTLMVHRGQILPTEVIVERVWGYSGRGDRELVRGLVSRLRAKIEPEPHNPRFILTQPGVGYAFDPQGTEPVP